MEEIWPILLQSYNDPLIRLFFWIMSACFIAETVFSKDLKSTIVSAGVLGTFLGVFLGLWHFDTSDITGSVPKLLEGLKLAFTTSILGMFFAIMLTVKDIVFRKKSSESSTNSLLQSLLNSFREMSKNISKTNDSLNKNLETISKEFKTVISCMNQSVKNTDDRLNMINSSLKEALNILSKGATEEIISALEKVISDFNKNLTEQFGDNFKQLNESVKNMIVWQENYKVITEQSEKHLQKILTSLETNAEYSEKLRVNFEKISETGKDLSSVIRSNENQIKNIEIHMKKLKKIGDEASLIVASINDFSQSIQNSLSVQSQGLNSLSKELEGSLGALNKTLTALTDKFRSDYKSYLTEFENLLKRALSHK